MKKLLGVALLCFSFQANATDRWTKSDIAREAVYLTLHVVDWGQTRDSVDKGYIEKNAILGEYPSKEEVNRYFLITGLLHVAAAHLLPSDWRGRFQYSTIAVQVYCVHNNYNLGLKIQF